MATMLVQMIDGNSRIGQEVRLRPDKNEFGKVVAVKEGRSHTGRKSREIVVEVTQSTERQVGSRYSHYFYAERDGTFEAYRGR